MSSTGRGSKRKERDAYPTPSWCVEVLIPEIVWGDQPRIWEPAAGDGAMLDVLTNNIHGQFYGTDIEPRADHILQRDFFDIEASELLGQRWDFIVTNPPFSMAQEFLDKAVRIANCVIMLLPLGLHGSQERHEWWSQNEPIAQHVLSRRPMFAKNKDGKWGTDSETYAWMVWDATGRQKRGFFHLNPTDEQYKRSIEEFKHKYG